MALLLELHKFWNTAVVACVGGNPLNLGVVHSLERLSASWKPLKDAWQDPTKHGQKSEVHGGAGFAGGLTIRCRVNLNSLTGQITSAQQTAIPEPATMFLLGSGLAGFAFKARRW